MVTDKADTLPLAAGSAPPASGGAPERGLFFSKDYFLGQIRRLSPDADIALVEKALNFCTQAHRDQFRKSGEPFYSHAIETAKILAEFRMDTDTLCAGLLHDVLEDTLVSYDTLKAEFNETIANLVDGVTKISNIPFKSTEEMQVETYRKMLISTAKDIRVILIKLADRLHNLRTLHYLDAATIKRVAGESMNVYVPIAHRLGMAKIRTEMEDIAFKHLHPEDYEAVLSKVVENREQREKEIDALRAPLVELLQKENIPARVFGRPKHLYSIFTKMKSGKSFDDIYDLFAIRIIVKVPLDCYRVLGVVHSNWIPVQYRFKDYIATPKSNMYQSLHTAVIGPRGKMIEVQIRTEEMNVVAEDGVAAHWVYKEGGEAGAVGHDAAEWLKEIEDLPKDLTNHSEFMEFFKIDLFQSEIFVFTPKGDLVQLPRGSSVLDFAFSLHTNLGYQCVAGKINGQAFPMNTVLKSGVTVEIIKAKFQSPSPSWLNWVKTAKAKRDIRHWMKQKSFEHATLLGRELFEREIMRLGINEDYTEKLYKLFPHYKVNDLERFYNAIGHGEIPVLVILDRLFPEKNILRGQKQNLLRQLLSRRKKAASQSGLIVNAPDNMMTTFGKCCQPLPGDKIVGYLLRSKGIEIHRTVCTRGMMLMEKAGQRVDVGWDPNSTQGYKIKLQVISDSRMYLLTDISRALSDAGANILNAHTQQQGARSYHTYLVELGNRHHLNNAYRELRKIKGVRKISREPLFKDLWSADDAPFPQK
ncbi:MAG: bifunctional (p)ppGpp synthetase/guanosine-3',5'-bis(diphosphate) 3'-pyrophosphohydrolase [Fibrobacterota bacterium]